MYQQSEFLIDPHRYGSRQDQIDFLKTIKRNFGSSIYRQYISFYGKNYPKSTLYDFLKGNIEKLKPYQLALLKCGFLSIYSNEESGELELSLDKEITFDQFGFFEDNIIRQFILRRIASQGGFGDDLTSWIHTKTQVCAFDDKIMLYGRFYPDTTYGCFEEDGQCLGKTELLLIELFDLTSNGKRSRAKHNWFGSNPERNLRNLLKIKKYCKRAGIETLSFSCRFARELRVMDDLAKLGFNTSGGTCWINTKA